MLFATGAGVHRAVLSLGRAAAEDYQKTLAQMTLATLTPRAGLVSFGLTWGEPVPGENTLRRAASVEWRGRLGGRPVTLGASVAETDGSRFFGTAREDHITRLSASTPVGRVEVGGFVEERRSTVSAYDDVTFGATVRIAINLLEGR